MPITQAIAHDGIVQPLLALPQNMLEKKDKSLLDSVYVAAPCQVGWENMKGDKKRRQCSGCSKSVYNLSAISKKDGERLLDVYGDSICIHIERDRFGNLITVEGKQVTWLKIIRRLTASILGFILSAQTSIAKDGELKTPQTIARTEGPADTTLFEVDKTIVDGHPAGFKRLRRANYKQSAPKGELNPSWLTDAEARSIAKDFPKAEKYYSKADKRAFVFFQLAKHHESVGNTSYALDTYNEALTLANDGEHDPKFVAEIRLRYNSLAERLNEKLPNPSTKDRKSSPLLREGAPIPESSIK